MSKKVLALIIALLLTLIIVSMGCSTINNLCIQKCEDIIGSNDKSYQNENISKSIDIVVGVQCEELCNGLDDYCIPLCEELGLSECEFICSN